MENENNKRITLRIDKDLHRKMRIRTFYEERSINAYINELIKKDMEKYEKEKKKNDN